MMILLLLLSVKNAFNSVCAIENDARKIGMNIKVLTYVISIELLRTITNPHKNFVKKSTDKFSQLVFYLVS